MRFLFIGALFLQTLAHAANYYVDPATGAISNDGSAGSPWNTLAAVMGAKTFTGGDTVFLRSGYHGQVSVTGTNGSDVVITAQEGHNPQLKSIAFGTSRHWVLDGLTITPEAVEPYSVVSNLVYLQDGATFITVKNCSLYSVKDASGWDSAAWNTLACDVIFVRGRRNTLANNFVKNFNCGFNVFYDADSCLVENNTLSDFAGDALRGLGDYGVFQYNVVKNCYDVNDNHDDAFQSWSYADGSLGKGVVRGLVLRGNHFYNWDDPDQPFRGPLNGMGMFDGFFEDWLIENNLIVMDGYNGISFMGATNCTVINNTVVSIPNSTYSPLWIMVADHKDGTASTGNVVRNNLATSLNLVSGTVNDHNVASALAKACVNDYNNMDFTLKPGLTYAIDAGSSDGAPDVDFNGTPRPYGAGVDLGCYEYAPDAVHQSGYRVPLRGAGDIRLTPQPLRHEGVLTVTTTRAGMLGLALYDPAGRQVQYTEFAVDGKGTHALQFTRNESLNGLAVYAVTFDGLQKGQGHVIMAR